METTINIFKLKYPNYKLGEYEGIIYYFAPRGCGHSYTLDIKTNVYSDHKGILHKNFKILKEEYMFIKEENIINAYKLGDNKTRLLLVTLFPELETNKELSLLLANIRIEELQKELLDCKNK
jgi:hypothetical protein